jgi:hypothetical protein
LLAQLRGGRSLPPSLGIPDIFRITDESRIYLSSGINPGYIPNKSGMLDESGIYPGYIWDISGIYLGYIYIPDKSLIYPKYIPEYILDISGIYSQIYLGFQGWGVLFGETWKRVQWADSTCPRCGEEEEDLEHVLRVCPKLESPRRRKFVQVLPPLSAMSTGQVEVARFFREVFEWDQP